MQTQLGNTALGRHVKREWGDPEVKAAVKDVAFLYGAHKVFQRLPQVKAKARRYLFKPVQGEWGSGEFFVRGAKKRAVRGLSIFKHGAGLRRLGGMKVSRVARSGRNVLKLLRVVK